MSRSHFVNISWILLLSSMLIKMMSKVQLRAGYHSCCERKGEEFLYLLAELE